MVTHAEVRREAHAQIFVAHSNFSALSAYSIASKPCRLRRVYRSRIARADRRMKNDCKDNLHALIYRAARPTWQRWCSTYRALQLCQDGPHLEMFLLCMSIYMHLVHLCTIFTISSLSNDVQKDRHSQPAPLFMQFAAL